MKPTITIEQANQKVNDYLSQVREALPAKARYELTALEERGPCLDPADGGSEERVIATRTYQIFDLPKENIPAYFTAVKMWAPNHNFRVLDNNPPTEYLWLENNSDSIRMAFKANSLGGLYLIATSPCVWPNGTPITEAQAAEPAQDVEAQAAPSPAPQPPARKPRRAPVDDDDFAQTNWTDDDTY